MKDKKKEYSQPDMYKKIEAHLSQIVRIDEEVERQRIKIEALEKK